MPEFQKYSRNDAKINEQKCVESGNQPARQSNSKHNWIVPQPVQAVFQPVSTAPKKYTQFALTNGIDTDNKENRHRETPSQLLNFLNDQKLKS